MTTDSPAIQVAFPAVDQTDAAFTAKAVVPAPSTLDTGMATAVGTAAARRALSCEALLQGDTRARALAAARQLYPKMSTDTAVLMAYGEDSVAEVNALITKLLHQVKPVGIPELTNLMSQLNAGMRGIKRKYDSSDPAVREKYEHWKGGVGRFWHHARTLLDLFMDDVTSIEHQLDNVTKTLQGKQFEMVQFSGMYDELYDANERELLNLIYVIAVMEMVCDLGTQEAASIQVGDAAMGDREGERKARITQFVENLRIKIAEFKGRLALGWATSPSVRTMQSLDVSLAIKINELVNLTIPSMKATILQWRMLLESMDAAAFDQMVADASNEWTTAYAKSYAAAVPIIANQVETPTLNPATIAAMADAITQAADGVIAAVHAGDERRAALDAAMVAGHEQMAKATGAVSDAIIDQAIGAATGPLQIETHVPAALPVGSSSGAGVQSAN